MTVVSSSDWRNELQQTLLESFDLEGLDLLCIGLDVVGEDSMRQTPSFKAMNLVKQMERRQRLSELLDVCQRLRPTASWRSLRHLLPPLSSSSLPLSERFSVEIRPEILPGAGLCEVIIHNEGIQRTSYTIMGGDPIIALNFSEGQGQQKIVSPGKTKKVNLHVAPKKRPLIGRPQPYPFTVQVSTPTRNQQSVDRQIIVKPVLPVWAATLLAVLLLVMLVGSLWALNGRTFNHLFTAIIPAIGNTAASPSTATATPVLQLVHPTTTPVIPIETAVPLPTATATATPNFEFSEITNIGIDEQGNYVIGFKTYNFIRDRDHLHVHFFFDTVPPENAGVPGSGWKLYAGSSPFTGYSLADRPLQATEICILVANSLHHVRLNSGNCVPLP